MPLPFAALVLALLAFFLIAYELRPRRFYFVRHAQTELNAEHIRQGDEGDLSALGREQSVGLARYLAQFSIRRIVSSPLPRASETADILRATLHRRVRTSPLFVERKNPSEIIGKKTDDPEVERVVDQIENSYHADDYRYSDEENFVDLRKRAKKALGYLRRLGPGESCVVTHHVFLKMLVASMLYPKRLNAKNYAKLSFFNPSDNASITVCDYYPLRRFNKTRGWSVVAYNVVP